MVSETKIDDNFPFGNFLIDVVNPRFRLDLDSKCDVIMLYVRKNIPSNLLKRDKEHIEGIYVELNLWNKNHLIKCSYDPRKTMIKNHLATLSNSLGLHSSKQKMSILGDFNVGIDPPHMNYFCETYNLTN